MDKEAEEAYNKRQAEPLFKKASDMMPMPQLKAYQDSLICGYRKWDGCQLLVRDKSLYSCIYHQAMHAIGTDFFLYYYLINQNEYAHMTDDQKDKLIQRHEYMTKWVDNYPRGASASVAF